MLDYKRNGTYVEIGCHDPEYINNTYVLEKYFNWTGISLDNDTKMYGIVNVAIQLQLLTHLHMTIQFYLMKNMLMSLIEFHLISINLGLSPLNMMQTVTEMCNAMVNENFLLNVDTSYAHTH